MLFFMSRTNPISWAGQEVLLFPVGQEDDVSICSSDLFDGLYTEDDMAEELTEL